MPKVILTKPLDGFPEGSEREFDQVDIDRLAALGAVKLPPASKPTPEPKAGRKA